MSTFTNHVATEGQQVFTISFPYLDITHVRVMRNGVLCLIPGDYEWINASTFRMREPQQAGTLIQIRRFTQDNALVTYQNSATLTAEDLNVATLQNLYRTQELQDQINNYVESAVIRFASNGQPGQLTPEQLVAAAAQEILNSELLADLQARIGDIDINAESIITQTVRLDDMQAIVDSLTDIDGVGIATFIVAEQEARIEGDTAIVNDLSLLGAKSGDGLSWILDMNKVKVSSSESLASRLTSIASTLASNSAAITSEASTRATQDTALASSITGLAATVTSNNNTHNGNYTTLSSAISTEQTARANGDSTNATAITNLASTVTSNYSTLNAAISSEASTRASGDSANASAITTLQSTVTTHGSTLTSQGSAITSHTASLATHASTLATLDGDVVNLKAQYTVKVDVNGYVAGYGIAATEVDGEPSSEFIVLADKFAVVTPGESPKVPFVIIDGVCYMQDVVITNALIQNLTITKLTTGSLNADMSMGTGKIIFDNGAHMLVIGNGFGSESQFALWFGPHQSSYSSCTVSNSKFHLTTDGDAYFGGSLSAGVFHNSSTGTLLDATAEHTLGPFTTNGNDKQIVFSYSYAANKTTGGGGGNSSGSISATVNCYRKIGSASETLVATLNVTGSYSIESEPGLSVYTQGMAASTTFTDTVAGTDNRTYRMAIASRSLAFADGSRTQRMTITSTETP